MRYVLYLTVCLLSIFQLPMAAETDNSKVFLVYGGKTGWIGQQIVTLLQEQNYSVYAAQAHLENRQELENEVLALQPDFIINAAGATGRPNVDWCEDNKQETIRTNIIGALNLADISNKYQIHLTNFGTGCIYQYDEAHPLSGGIGFVEDDKPNFDGSFYSKTKIMLDTLLLSYPNVLNLRLRMPLSSEFHEKNFITKITKYQKVVNIPNSMTVLEDLLPLAIEMAIAHLTGNYNFTNPGTISHNEILALYKEYVDPNFTWTNFSVEEQNKILKCQRSNNELDVSKLLEKFPNVPPIQQSIIKVFERMKMKHFEGVE